MLLDETAAVIGADPIGWVARAFLPSLPLALAGLLFVHLHRVRWVREAWDLDTTALSLALSGGVVLALALRAVGQGHAARAVSQRLDPKRTEAMPAADVRSLAALAWLSAAACWLGFSFAVLPGLVATSFFLPAFAVCACEGRDAGSTLQRLGRMPRGTASKGFASALLFSLLALFVWLDVVVGTQGVLLLVRTLTGADVDVLARLLGPTNGPFLLSAGVVAAFLLDGVWCVYSAVYYVDARLGQSGADLLDRWSELAGPSARSVALLFVAATLGLPALAAAQDELELRGEDLGFDGEWEVEGEYPESPASYIADLVRWSDELELELAEYEESGFEALNTLRDDIRWNTKRTLDTPQGPLAVDGSILADELPEWIHTEETAAQARLFGDRLDAAIVRLQALLQPAPADPDASSGPPPGAARALLESELGSGEYELGEQAEAGDAFRESFQERWRAWLEDLWRRMSAYEPQQPQPSPGVLPEIDGRIVMAAVAAVIALIIVLFLLGQTRTLRVSAPESESTSGGPGGDLPDARLRSPLGWRGHADALAAEGLFRDAIRAQYLSVLARLDRTGEIEYRQERTNGEHLRTFRGLRPRQQRFGDATWTFEMAWYGEAEVDATDYGGMTALCDTLVLRDAPGDTPPEEAARA